ncbi:hypothetical protein ACP4OV_014504 [Aristida adscensionis]
MISPTQKSWRNVSMALLCREDVLQKIEVSIYEKIAKRKHTDWGFSFPCNCFLAKASLYL